MSRYTQTALGALLVFGFLGSIIADSGQSKKGETPFWVSGPQSSTLHATRSGDGRICVEAKINGRKYNFYVDTGASSTLHSEIAKKLRISASDSGASSVDPSGNSTPILTANVDFDIGGYAIHGIPVMVSDLSALRKMNADQGLPVLDGIIGSDVLSVLRAKINFGENTLVFLRPLNESR